MMPILKRHENKNINELINQTKKDNKNTSPHILKLKNDEIAVCAKVYKGKKLFGILLAIFPSQKEKI